MLRSPLMGTHNALNLLGVLGVLLASEIPLERALATLARLQPVSGRMQTLGHPVKSTTELARSRAPAPWLGQHTADVLRELGRSESEIAALFAERVVYDRRRNEAGR